MALKKGKKMLQVSISLKQYEWLDNFCSSRGITKSKYIKWMLCKKAEEMLVLLKFNPENVYTQEELQEILSTKWLDEDE